MTFSHAIQHSDNQQKTEDETRRDLSLFVEDLFSALLFRADVYKHDYEEEKDHHAADVNEYLHTGNELRPREYKKRRDRDERRDQKQRAMHGIARHHGQQPRKDRREPEDPEEECFVTGKSHFVLATKRHKKHKCFFELTGPYFY